MEEAVDSGALEDIYAYIHDMLLSFFQTSSRGECCRDVSWEGVLVVCSDRSIGCDA